MTIHLRDNNGTEIRAVLERPALCFRSLSDTRIQDQHSHIWPDSVTNLYHLLEQLGLLFMPP